MGTLARPVCRENANSRAPEAIQIFVVLLFPYQDGHAFWQKLKAIILFFQLLIRCKANKAKSPAWKSTPSTASGIYREMERASPWVGAKPQTAMFEFFS